MRKRFTNLFFRLFWSPPDEWEALITHIRRSQLVLSNMKKAFQPPLLYMSILIEALEKSDNPEKALKVIQEKQELIQNISDITECFSQLISDSDKLITGQ